MDEASSRTAILLGAEALERLAAAEVAVFGLGGVGSYAAESLARAGVGGLVLVDGAATSESNLNRQLVATRSALGRPKVEVMRERILDVNPAARVEARRERVGAGDAARILRPGMAYVIDAVDTLTAKIDIVLAARELGVPVVSAMGAGNKLDPTRVEVADLYATRGCPLARAMRRELRRRGLERLTVVYSREEPVAIEDEDLPCRFLGNCEKGRDCPCEGRRAVPGSSPFVPAVFGLVAASVAVRDIVGR
jgi:tRNA threonylcarbamoyladenosine dehydratase